MRLGDKRDIIGDSIVLNELFSIKRSHKPLTPQELLDKQKKMAAYERSLPTQTAPPPAPK